MTEFSREKGTRDSQWSVVQGKSRQSNVARVLEPLNLVYQGKESG